MGDGAAGRGGRTSEGKSMGVGRAARVTHVFELLHLSVFCACLSIVTAVAQVTAMYRV